MLNLSHNGAIYTRMYLCMNISWLEMLLLFSLFVDCFFFINRKKHPIIGLTTCIYYALRLCCCCNFFSLIELDSAFWLSGFCTRASTMLYAKRIFVSKMHTPKKNDTFRVTVVVCFLVLCFLATWFLDRFDLLFYWTISVAHSILPSQ